MGKKEENSSSGGGIGKFILVLVILFFCWIFADDEDLEDTEPIVNSGTDKYTLMVYMCGSNLETDGGYASDDIEEMLESQLADEINLLIYTGGANSWYNEEIPSNRNLVFKVEDHKLKAVNDSIGMKYFSNPNTLLEFLNWSKDAYPADKYGLVFWDHGGGAVGGFGYDEHDPNENESLTIDEIKYALDRFDPKLEFIGFDACLMASFETAYAFKDHANYFIASEETEPGTGWEYKKLLNQLSRNTSQSTVEFGKVVVDSFIKSNDWFFGADATLSVVDLSKMNNVYNNSMNFMRQIQQEKFNINDYKSITRALNDSKAFADGELDTVDFIDFSSNTGLSSASGLKAAIEDCVSYNGYTSDLEGCHGLSLYFPNEDLENFDKMRSIYKNIGFDDEYINILTEYVNVIAGGSRRSYVVNNKTYETEENYEDYSWFDSDFADEYSDYYEANEIDMDELEVEDRGDYYALHLTDEQWENIVDVGSSVWYDDGEGYWDLGIDSYFEFDESDDLKIEFDGTWIAINGNVVRYEVSERTEKYEKGKVPALLNGEWVNLILYWDEKNPDGKVLGAEPVNEPGSTALFAKGYTQIKKGDKIEFLVDYYDYYGNYDDSYVVGELVVADDELKISYEWVGDGECIVYYVLTDMFNNTYYTEPVILY